ncbi:hypothetical protein CSB45_03630 [candidate division KSB3 bacterium]|uniref:Uncharacterized protein n=1 Tax=candidate division KSB3 bacterium TaxID=2044937 RepID=A0A2G6E971_9BACT|nr:MAG: hypothetical protein CSB45_03630 [candidate division KSB3 bacterium]PIE29584.1 MAG: hypothetical protein CSA57_08225 [candidate division KSB3 bacterium]
MFKPLKMVNVALQVLHSDAAKVTHVIAKMGLFHLLDSRELSKTAVKIGGEAFQECMSRYTALNQELKELCGRLSLARKVRKDLEVEPEQELQMIEDAVKRIQKKLSLPAEQITRLERQRKHASEQLALLRSISPAGADLEVIRKFSYLYKQVGFVATKDIPRLEASLGAVHVTLQTLIALERRSLIVVLCSQKDKDVLNRALKSAYFEAVDLPPLERGAFSEILEKLETEIQQLAEKKTALSLELQDTQKEAVEELQDLREKVSIAMLILQAEQHYAAGTRSYIIQGWLPATQTQRFQNEIVRVTEGRARIEFSEAEMVEEVRKGTLKIPILFHNPYLVRPFETILFNYGTQDYQALDPTPIIAISFLLMFGVMFGDVGHGLVLFLIGRGLCKHCYQMMDLGIIMMECGVSSAVFGLLYGSIFGVEHWIPALWFHPAEHIGQFMAFALGFGVLMISAGIILNILNSFRRKDYEAGILGHYGIIGALFYWLSVGLGLKYAVYGDFGISSKALILLLGMPLGVIFFKEPLAHILFKKEDGGDESMFPSGIGMFLMESVIDVIDVVVRYLASTVSFIRTAAFALAHGGLFIAVFSLADIVENMKGGGLWYWLVILLGNVLIIALEGLVVSIQTVRLEYYEFFSKFFKDGGERFHPLKIE